MFRRPALAALTALVAGATALLAGAPAALAVQPRHSAVVSAVPQDGTPQIQNGSVFAITQVGSTTVVGGSFTSTASSDPAAPLATPYVLAFDAATGMVRTAFAPQLNGTVFTLLPGPTAGTVYVGGAFSTVRGAPGKGLVLLNLSDGSRVGGFGMPPTDGTVQTVKRLGDRLYVGGTFRTVGGVAHAGLVTLGATTGALDPYLASSVATNHNWTPSSPSTWAKGAVGVFRLDLSPDGSKLVAIGNFKQVDGATHDQIAMWDLPVGGAALRAWNTTRLQPACLASRFDSYARDVDFSPDGTYFSLVTSGSYREGELCDSASRWETAASGPDVQPTWVAYTGQDSLLSTAVTGEAVYVGGHQRWLDNGLAHDRAGPGAVPRPGLAALDPANGLPLAWNPGRNPRGAGTYAMYATDTGLWTGSDTDYIGNRLYKRGKVAFFPLAGGAPAAATTVPALPAELYQGTVPAAPPSGVLFRVNAGGALLQSVDAGPDWAADTANTSPYRTAGSVAAGYGTPVPHLDASVPAGTPTALFSSERQDRGTKGDTGEMQWRFAVPAGTSVELRLYFANRCPCASTPGSRTFDVTVDGVLRLDHFDALSAGDQTGTVRAWTLTSDGSVDIAFGHEAGDPFVSGIELVRAGSGPSPSPTGSLRGRSFDGSTAGPATAAGTALDVAQVRGATVIGSSLFYGRTDGNLYRRTTNGTTFGPETLLDPYDDPYWSAVSTGSGNVYRGLKPAFNDEITQLTSMFYDGHGRLYYTLYRQSGLFYRDFSPDSGTVHYERHQVVGASLPDITGAFLAGGRLYYATRADGALSRVAFDGVRVTGTPRVVSGPAQDGVDWRSRVLYLGPVPGSNAAPTAAFTAGCELTACTFDGGGSTDADGTVASYAWTFGDGSRGSGRAPSHTYAAAGTYPVTLTVTDGAGATGSVTRDLVVQAAPASPIAFHGSSSVQGVTASQLQVPVPSGTRTGDALLLKVSTSGTATDPKVPAGWTELTRSTAGTMLTVLWQRVATAQDAPLSDVPVTLATGTKSSSQLLAYGGTAATPVSAVAAAADPALVTEHPAPAVPVARSGSWVVRFWTDKSSTTTLWTLAAGTERARATGTGTGYLTAVVADDGAARAAGTAPAASAATDAASRAVGISVVLAPAP